MENPTSVIEYKCPCCGAGLQFRGEAQQLSCEYCDNSFDIDTVRAFNASEHQENSEEFQWEQTASSVWSSEEQAGLHAFQCPSCGAEIMTEETTAASFCPFCDNPTILPGRLSGGLKPDAILPFRTSREDAKEAFRKLCKGKPLLPSMFTQQHRIEKITGMYVPFWLYDCSGKFDADYKATRIHTWSDTKYNYTRTEHFLLKRAARADFVGIPMDGSSKMEDTFMESIEPFDYTQLVDFDMAFLSGYLADKYDEDAEKCADRADQRARATALNVMSNSVKGYATCIPTHENVRLRRGRVKYALMPVWMLSTQWKGQNFLFAMNGQTGRLIGDLPISKGRLLGWFAGISLPLMAILYLLLGG